MYFGVHMIDVWLLLIAYKSMQGNVLGGNKLCLVRTPKQQNFINRTLLIKQQIYKYKTAVYTLVNGGIQGLTHQKQQKS